MLPGELAVMGTLGRGFLCVCAEEGLSRQGLMLCDEGQLCVPQGADVTVLCFLSPELH